MELKLTTKYLGKMGHIRAHQWSQQLAYGN